MKNMTILHRRSCFDHRTTSNRRDRWWPFFKKQTVLKNRRIDNDFFLNLRRKVSKSLKLIYSEIRLLFSFF